MGTALAALINGRARKVTPAVVGALRHALPDSTILTKARAGAAKNVGPTRDRARAPAWPGV